MKIGSICFETPLHDEENSIMVLIKSMISINRTQYTIQNIHRSDHSSLNSFVAQIIHRSNQNYFMKNYSKLKKVNINQSFL